MHATVRWSTICLALFWCVMLLPAGSHAQDTPAQTDPQETQPPEIPDEPKTVDPALHVPPQLAEKVTVEFPDSSLREVAQWIQTERELPVLFDKKALSAAGIPLGEPITDHLTDEPIYLLLNRLSSLGLAWYVDDNVLHITTTDVAQERMSTVSYNLGDLLDAGYKPQNLLEATMKCVGGPWIEDEGKGGVMEWLGDVLFVRQTDQKHREITGLLTAIRKHGRQTFSFDPPQHMSLRQKLNENVSVQFADVPLVSAAKQLADQTGANIRLDIPALRERRIRDREPISLTLTDRKLSTTLQILLADLELTWILRDGVLWITSASRAEEHQKTAVYDVRDLCRNDGESAELTEAIISQTTGPWEEDEGEGGTIAFAKPGTMVIRQTEQVLSEIRELLHTYRQALVSSKRRDRGELDPNELVTRYYRMNTGIANDLTLAMHQLVQPGTWATEQTPEAPGSILKVASEPAFLGTQQQNAQMQVAQTDGRSRPAVFVPQSVLIIHQTRAAHEEIVKVVRRIERGDPPEQFESRAIGGGGGGGFGGGGFGGSYGGGFGGGYGGGFGGGYKSGGFGGGGFYSVPKSSQKMR